MLSNHLILWHPLLLPPSIFPSTRVFSNESVLRIRWPKYWNFSFSVGPSNEYSGLISFRMDWLDLLAVQGTLKSLLQHHSSKASILWYSAFFIVQLSQRGEKSKGNLWLLPHEWVGMEPWGPQARRSSHLTRWPCTDWGQGPSGRMSLTYFSQLPPGPQWSSVNSLFTAASRLWEWGVGRNSVGVVNRTESLHGLK